MGFLKDLVGIAAPIAGTFLGGPIGGAIGGALGGMASSSGQPKSQTTTQQQKMDPHMEQMLFGGGGQTGLLSQYQGMMNDPRSAAATGYANVNADYLNSNGGTDMNAVRNAAMQSMQGNQAPTMQAAQAGGAQAAGAQVSGPAWATGNMVQAPAQNGLNLSGSYDSLINGPAGANPFLTGGIQKGINQSTNAFGSMVTDAKAATQDVLGSIRGNSVLSGQFGGSRQGIAEGKAIDSMNTNLSRAASQFGQNNTDAAVAAQAGAYDSDRNRQLAATQGLGAQQYGVAQQDAATKNQAEFMNVGTHNGILQNNASMAQQNNQFNAGLGQQTGQYNAGLQQQAGLANQQSQLSTNAQNNGQLLNGASMLSGLSGQASGQVNANDNWKLQQAQGVNSLLAPYLGANNSSTTSQPLYNNPVAAGVGGGLMGAQLGGAFGGGTDYNAIRNGTNAGSNLGNMLGFGGPASTSLQTNGSAGSYNPSVSTLQVPSLGFGW